MTVTSMGKTGKKCQNRELVAGSIWNEENFKSVSGECTWDATDVKIQSPSFSHHEMSRRFNC